MKMAELSERSGVTVPTIKYYLREGMVPPGEYSSPNQAAYGEQHVDRLKLVRALIDVGGLSVSAVSGVLAAVDDQSMPLKWAFGIAQHALPNPGVDAVRADAAGVAPGAGSGRIAELLAHKGWVVSADNPGIALAARVVESYDALGLPHLSSVLEAYADAAAIIAEADLEAVALRSGRAEQVESVVVGTVLGDALLAGLRRIAQEHESASAFPDGSSPDGSSPDGCSPDGLSVNQQGADQ